MKTGDANKKRRSAEDDREGDGDGEMSSRWKCGKEAVWREPAAEFARLCLLSPFAFGFAAWKLRRDSSARI